MKKRIMIILALTGLLLSLGGSSIALALAPESITSFTFTPSDAFAGDSVTFRIDFTVVDEAMPNTICLYFDDTTYESTIDAIGSISSGNFGDTYTQANGGGGAGESTTNCASVTGFMVTEWTVADPHPFSPGGDYLQATFTVPSGAATEVFTSQQFNTSLINSLNSTLTIISSSTVFVANNTTDCGANTPCVVGPTALGRAVDGVTTGGTVIILGNYLMDATATADLEGARSITVSFQGGATLGNDASGACSGAMLENASTGTLTVQNGTFDGTCSAGSRSAGILNSTTGTTNVTNMTIQDFTGTGNTGAEVTAGTMVVQGSTFSNNEAALEGTGGTLYAFANNVTTNNGADAATGIDSTDDVGCNYWGSATIAGTDSSAQFALRLGSQVSSYVEGSGAQTLGAASLAAGTGNQVLVNMGRDTVNPPFNNGTVSGLGALVSDFFGACNSQGGTAIGLMSVTGDAVTPGSGGFRLYSIVDPADCSPSTNAACWDYQGTDGGTGASSARCTSAGCTVTDEAANAGHFVIGNEVDPTAIVLTGFTARTSSTNTVLLTFAIIAGVLALAGGIFTMARRRSL